MTGAVLASFVLAVLALAIVAFRAVSGMNDAAEKMRDVAESAVSALAQAKGVPPHQAAPAVFSPGGQSWDAIERGKVAKKAMGSATALMSLKSDIAKVNQAVNILMERRRPEDESHLKELRARRDSLENQVRQLEEVNG